MPGFIPGKVSRNFLPLIVAEPSLSNRILFRCAEVSVPGWRSTQSSDDSIGISAGFSVTAMPIVKKRYHARKSNTRPRSTITKTPQPSGRQLGIFSTEEKYGLMLAPPEVG